ncbi:hypothetical protein EJB05_20119, partial [Eragrostis curvula]
MVMGNKATKSSKAEGARCRRHPRHRQGAGVCASCLRDRLSHLSLSASLPSVVRGCGGEEEEGGGSSCSEASTAYSSEESSGCSSAAAASGRASPGGFHFHDEARRAGRPVSLLMRHERVVGDADAVAAFLQARREQRRTAATSFWAKLLNATRGGGGAKQSSRQDGGCSMAHSKTLQERVAAAKWIKTIDILFFALELEPFPAPEKVDYTAKEIASNQQRIHNHNKWIYPVEASPKERNRIINGFASGKDNLIDNHFYCTWGRKQVICSSPIVSICLSKLSLADLTLSAPSLNKQIRASLTLSAPS